MSIVLYFFVRKIPLEAVASGDSLDWKDLSATEITDRVVTKVKPGSIVLFHNAALHTPEALPMIIETLQTDGYKIVPVSQLIYTKDYTIDPSGMQIPKNAEKKEKKPETKSDTQKNPNAVSTDVIL